MSHQNTLELGLTVVAITDMQEAFRSVIPDFTEMSARIARVAHAAQILGVSLIVTEQYPKGLGRTVNEIMAVLPESIQVIEKTAFSSCGAAQFEAELERTGARQVVIAGIEAHICVNQTVHDLLARGYGVHLLTDCIAARSQLDRQTALAKMRQSGAVPSTTEMALFELMRDARHDQFKSIQRLIK
jgi:nicotinamidase-related amidase